MKVQVRKNYKCTQLYVEQKPSLINIGDFDLTSHNILFQNGLVPKDFLNVWIQMYVDIIAVPIKSSIYSRAILPSKTYAC